MCIMIRLLIKKLVIREFYNILPCGIEQVYVANCYKSTRLVFSVDVCYVYLL